MESDYATVTSDTKIELLQGVLADARAAIVVDHESVVGIVTKIDLIEFLSKRHADILTAPRAKKTSKKKSVTKKSNGPRANAR